MNRAIARRPLFESERDLRWLRSRVGREVRRGRLEGLAHRRLLVRYIDSNPVEARMCAWPWEYPRGSAADHVRRRPRPRLAREWVGTVLADQLESGSTRLDAYRACFSPRVSDAARVMFESSLERQNTPLHSEIDMVLEGGSALSERPSRALTVAALRSLAGSSWPEVAAFTCITRSRAQHLFAEERAGLLRTDRAYRAAFDGITRSLVAEVVD